jgi:hypothetical protein
MKPVHELLGFVVLTGPLWIIIILFVIAFWLNIKFAERFPPGSKRWAVATGIFLLVFSIPFADEIAGRIYLNHLCATQAGVRVYKAIELPKEYWDERGRPRFLDNLGYPNQSLWAGKTASRGHVRRYSSVFFIDKDVTQIKEKSSAELRAEITTFRFLGGWIMKNFNPSSTASASCEFMDAPDFGRKFSLQLFKPKQG